jgi:putative FmdB family regulatory protein
MPIYEYRCQQCGRTFQKLQRVGAGAGDVRCPHCGAAEVERQLSTFASTSTGGASASTAAGVGCGGGGFT